MQKMKHMTKELKHKFFKHLCEATANEYNLETTFNVNSGIHKFILFSTDDMSSSSILDKLNKSVYQEMITFIETETEEEAKAYDRNITMFESETNDVNLIITW